MKFIANEPALIIDSILIIADIHLGVEHEYRKSGISMPSQTEKMLKKIESLVRKTKAKKLIVIGDIKHNVPGTSFQEERDIPLFFGTLSKKIHVEIIPGNHDDRLAKLLPHTKIHPSSGILVNDVYLMHGHRWPKPDFLKANFLVISHTHPLIEFRDKLGYRWMEKVWIRSELNPKVIGKKYKYVKKLPKLIVMPAFSDMVGGIAVNSRKKPIGPLLKCIIPGKSNIYMLDGTLLGSLENLQKISGLKSV